MSRNRIFVLTDAGLISMVIGVSVSPILIVIRELLQEERSADPGPRHRLAANWAYQKAVPECIHQVSELGEDTEDLLIRAPAAPPER